jgi:hypothetical protein
MLFKVFKETQEKPRKDRNSDSAILVTKALHIWRAKVTFVPVLEKNLNKNY